MRNDDSQAVKLASRKAAVLWAVQTLLALVFLFAGAVKLVMPIEAMQAGMKGSVVLPGWLLRFIGTAEVLGALGLILPGLLRVWRSLTPLAAAGLVVIMTGATVFTAAAGSFAPALMPFAVGLLAAFVAHGRSPSMVRNSDEQPARHATALPLGC